MWFPVDDGEYLFCSGRDPDSLYSDPFPRTQGSSPEALRGPSLTGPPGPQGSSVPWSSQQQQPGGGSNNNPGSAGGAATVRSPPIKARQMIEVLPATKVFVRMMVSPLLCVSNRITSNRITSNRINSNRITSNGIISNRQPFIRRSHPRPSSMQSNGGSTGGMSFRGRISECIACTTSDNELLNPLCLTPHSAPYSVPLSH